MTAIASLVLAAVAAAEPPPVPVASALPPPPPAVAFPQPTMAGPSWMEDRASCEYTRQRTIGSWKSGGGFVGLTIGYPAGFLIESAGHGDYAGWGFLAGAVGGYVIGYGLGALIGHKVAPHCELVDWTDASRAEWREYLSEEELFNRCMKKRSRVIQNWMLAGTVVGGVIGALVPPSKSGGNGARVADAVVGGLFGMIVGSIIGDYAGPDCRFTQAIRFSMP